MFNLVDKSQKTEKYLFLNTIREIILHNPNCLQAYLTKLLPMLVAHCSHEEESIRSVVAEIIGRLFVFYSMDMSSEIESGMKSKNHLVRATIAKSFKSAAVKETDEMQLNLFATDLIKMIGDTDLQVKQNSLEALTQIIHNRADVIKSDVKTLCTATFKETPIKPELITEVDLGPFKHKEDRGIPIRKQAFSLLDTIVEKMPERCDLNSIMEVIVEGLKDSAEEVMVICLNAIGRILRCAPGIVAGSLDIIVDFFEQQFSKNLKMISGPQSTEKAQNIIRTILRLVEALTRNADAEGHPRFSDFYKSQVLENASAKDMYEKIAASASKAVMGDNF